MKIIFFLSRILLALVAIIIVTAGCNSRPTESIDITGLLINNNDMPPHWPFSEFSDVGIDKDRSRDSVAISFNSDLYPDTFSSMQNVYRFSSVFDAKQDYETELEFYKRYYYVPSEWTFTSAMASTSHISCKDNIFPICVWVARYNNVVIELQASLIPGRMSFNDMENIVKEIDTRAGKLIINSP
jgi:hypothetical protein